MKWQDIEQKARNAVVQLFNYRVEFAWDSPYTKKPGDISTGTGFFISETGVLLSNFHVIESSASLFIQVPTLGKEKLKVTVLGVVPERDIAVLQVDEIGEVMLKKHFKTIPYLTLGDSDTVKPTNEVLALGYPLGEQILKATKGIVSGLTEWYLQIDASLNPGNSGGPSLNNKGQVIGINSAIQAQAQNMSFIIPSNTVSVVLPALPTSPLLLLPALGFRFQEASLDLIKYLNNPLPGGMYVYKVIPTLLFHTAGIKAGDMIYSINENKIDRFGEIKVPWSDDKVNLRIYFNRVSLGSRLKMVIYRQGKRKTKQITYEMKHRLPVSLYYPDFEQVGYIALGGLILMDLRLNHVPLISQIRPLFNRFYKEENQLIPRVIVVQVLPGSITQTLNLFMPGDIISEMDETPIFTLTDVKQGLLKRIQTKSLGPLLIRTEEEELATIDWTTLLNQEPLLVQQFGFQSILLKLLENIILNV